jgi:hypothetical protein
MRFRLGFLVLLMSLGGCGSQLSKSDLGTVVFEVPKIVGVDEPYQMPQLGPPLEHTGEYGRPHMP